MSSDHEPMQPSQPGEKFDCTFIVFGEPASKANQRRLVTIRGRPALIKSQKAMEYTESFKKQAALQVKKPTTADVRVEIMIHYASRRPDLDDSIILDAMQGIVYENDRQVKQRMIYWGLSKDLPRATIRVTECDVNDVPAYLMTE